jgi:alpha-galactosidase
MGWNSWNKFGCNVSDSLIRQMADNMVSSGMKEAGYEYVVIDDCWQVTRDANGNILPDEKRFPHGMKALADYIHGLGLKFGIYSCAGSKTCQSRPGSRGYQFQDARQYAEWGVDYLKYDWCNAGDSNPKDAYTRMRDALYTAKRPIVFSICEWGGSKPWEWAKDVGHLWRTTGDIMDCYDCKQRWEQGWKVILDLQYSQVQPADGQNNGIGKYAGPGHWNDPDMLEVGNEGLTLAESRSHFSFWCILAAPLIAGNDVRHMSPEITAILTDKEAIAIDQDSLGKEGWRFRAEPGHEIWVRELSGGDWAVAVLNSSRTSADVEVDFNHGWWFTGGERSVRDIWDKKEVGTTKQVFKKRLDSHDVAFLRLKPLKK